MNKSKFQKAKEHAASRGIEFSLTEEEYNALMQYSICFYTKKKIFDRSEGQDERFTRTLDRINPSIGYTKDNTVACAYFVNQIKSQCFENVIFNRRTLAEIIITYMVKAGADFNRTIYECLNTIENR